MKKILCTIACIMLVCVLLSSCSEAVDNPDGDGSTKAFDNQSALVGNIPVEFPLVSEPATLNILISSYDGINQENVFVWKQYEKMTGVDVNWTSVEKRDRAEVVYSALTNNQSFDMILRCKISSSSLTQYGEEGLILDLAKDDMLKKYAPNCWAYLKSHPDTLASVTNPDGSIYALPQVNSGAELRVARKIFINKTWLANVGMDVPKTTEELYALLKAFKAQDANGNGDSSDEIPLCSMDWKSLKEAFFGAFGLGNRGLHNPDIDFDKESGGVRLIAASDGYRDFLEYFNQLFTEGLLDSHIFSMTDDQWYSKIESDSIGMFSSTNLASLPADKVDNWVSLDEALEGPNGDKMWSAVRANFHSTGAAVIPSTCANPELCLRWLDYFWTDEGTLFYHMGVEGKTFIKNADGAYDYTADIYEKMTSENRSFDNVVADYSPYPGGSNPTVEVAPYFMGGEMAEVPARAARAMFDYAPEECWPSFTFTNKESSTLEAMRSDVEQYCESMLIDFVTGVKPLTEWESYKAHLEQLGTANMLKIYQAAVDRYNTLSAES